MTRPLKVSWINHLPFKFNFPKKHIHFLFSSRKYELSLKSMPHFTKTRTEPNKRQTSQNKILLNKSSNYEPRDCLIFIASNNKFI